MSSAFLARPVGLALPLLLSALALPARSEVRFEARPEPRVEVRMTPTGPWAPVGPMDHAVLNPSGDLRGDGGPTWTTTPEGPVVAWASPLAGTVRLARWREAAWETVGVWPARVPVGTPLVVTREESVGATWREMDGESPRVVLGSGESDVVSLVEDAALLMAHEQGETLHLLVLEQRSTLALHSLVLRGGLPAEPIDVAGRIRTVLETFESAEPSTGIETSAPQIVANDRAALLGWWSGNELRHVRLTTDGPELPVRILEHRGQGRPAGLLRSLLARDR